MKLLLRRDQKAGMMGMGKIAFTLDVRAQLTDKEQENVKKYKLGDTMLYEREKLVDGGAGLLGAASRLAFRALNLTVSVKDLSEGKRIECKDIVEMLAVEDVRLPQASSIRTVTGGLIATPATVVAAGCCANRSTAGSPAVMLNAVLVAPVSGALAAVSV